MEIVDGKVVTRQRSETVSVYFIQAVRLELIKIGVAERAESRLRGLAMASPDSLEVLGYQICHRYGALETELHERFKEYRRHGEWFLPAKPILDHINSFAVTTGRVVDRLNAVVQFPTMKRGRPSREMMQKRALAGLGKWQ